MAIRVEGLKFHGNYDSLYEIRVSYKMKSRQTRDIECYGESKIEKNPQKIGEIESS